MVCGVEALGAASALGEGLGVGAVSGGGAGELRWRALSKGVASIPKLSVGVQVLAGEAWQVGVGVQLPHYLKLEFLVWRFGVVRREEADSTGLEAHHIRQALALAWKHWIAFLVEAECADLAIEATESIPATSWHQLALRSQIVVLLQIKDGRLREQEVFSDVLAVVPALGLLLVHLIDKSLDFVRFVTAKIDAEANATKARPLLGVAPLVLRTGSKQLRLE